MECRLDDMEVWRRARDLLSPRGIWREEFYKLMFTAIDRVSGEGRFPEIRRERG